MGDFRPSSRFGGDNRGAGVIANEVVVAFLAATAVALRLATRKWIVRNVGWDDYTIVCAVLGMILSIFLVSLQVHYGFGRHKADITERQYVEFMKYSYGEWIQTFQTLMFNKISICFFLLRIPVDIYFIRPIQGTIVALVVSNIILTLLWIFQCNPVSRAWNKQTSGSCLTDAQLQRVIISQALISIISDFALALFPIVLLWKVQITLRLKAGLCGLMALGLITASCCIVRTVMNWQNVNSDPTWESIDNWYWRSWEVCIGIVAACIPTLRPGYRTVMKAITTFFARRTSRSKSSGLALVGPDIIASAPSGRKPSNVHIIQPKASYDPAFKAAARSLYDDADRAEHFRVVEEGFAMRPLPGDKRVGRGMQRTTRVDDTDISESASRRSLDLGVEEERLGYRSFL